jgi:2'-5' RNA ligase
MPPIRTFIAFDTPEPIRKEMSVVQFELKKAKADVKWESEQKFHATIKFLGNVDESTLPSLLKSIESTVLKFPAFEVAYQNVGAFPTITQPRVIWIGCINREGTLENLKNELDTVLLRFGIKKEERAFHPHITLGRVKSAKGIQNLTSILEKITFEATNAVIKEIVVMKSKLKREGSEYAILKSIPLL